jgi:hypothetical protein
MEDCDDCGECEICEPIVSTYKIGHVLGNDEIGIGDAVETLKYVVKLDSVLKDNANSHAAATIVGDEPSIADAVEILKYVVRLPNAIEGTA